MRGLAGGRVGGQRVGEIGQRVADRRQLPVQDAHDPGRGLAGEYHVAQAQVAVQKRGRTGLRHRPGQLVAELCELRGQGAVGVGDDPRQTGELALEEAVGAAEVLEAACAPVDGVQRPERIDERLADAAPLLGVVETGRQRRGADLALQVLHDVEGHVHRLALARDAEHRGHRHVRARERLEDARLAQHVVGARRERARRRAAQYNGAPARRDGVGEVGVPVADALHHDGGRGDARPLEPGLERLELERESAGRTHDALPIRRLT